VIELDTYHFHSDRPSFEKDHKSTLALMAAGYKVLRPTDEMLEDDPRLVLNLVRESLHPGV
jgi:very-short-patch-repair endonuclease